jgi:sulfopyruvate decarboxylase subunit alpha
MANVRLVLRELRKQAVSHVIGLPDNSSAALFSILAAEGDPRLIKVTREGEAFAVAAGLWLGGKTPVVLIQNTGLLESGDSFRGTVLRMRVPLVCLITYRGYAKLTRHRFPPRPEHLNAEVLSRPGLDSVALMTEPTLRAWNLPFVFLHGDEDIPKIGESFSRAEELSQPVAIFLSLDKQNLSPQFDEEYK